MNYSLSNMLGGGMVGGLDPSAKGYIAAVTAAGATVTSAQRGYINNFYKSAKADYYTSLKRLYLPIWGVAAANAIDMISLTSGTFVGGVTHASGYVQGNGTTGYFDTLVNPAGAGMTVGSQYLAILHYTAPSVAITSFLGAGGTSTSDMFCVNSNVYYRYGLSSTEVTGSATKNGIFSGSKTSGNSSIYRRAAAGKSTLGSTSVSDASALTPSTFFFLATNENDFGNKVPANLSNAQAGAFVLGSGLSSAHDTLFTLHLKNLWEGCTGLTLP